MKWFMLVILLCSIMVACENSREKYNTIADYCEENSDCVRQDVACDCGLGTWVNIPHYKQLPPDTARCKCALHPANPVCIENHCGSVAVGAD